MTKYKVEIDIDHKNKLIKYQVDEALLQELAQKIVDKEIAKDEGLELFTQMTVEILHMIQDKTGRDFAKEGYKVIPCSINEKGDMII